MRKQSRAQQRERDAREQASREAEYWVRVRRRYERMLSRKMDRDPRIQALMRNDRDPMKS